MSSKRYHCLEVLHCFSDRWHIKVMLSRILEDREYHTRKGAGRINKLILIDEKSDQILLTLFNDEIPKFGTNLCEGSCYTIRNIRVKPAPDAYNVVRHDYQLTLARDSSFVQITDPCLEIPFIKFYFVPIDSLPSLLNKVKFLPDIIGIIEDVTGISYIRKQDGTELAKLDVTLYDESLKKLNLTLWGELASYHFHSLTSNVGRVLLTTSIVVKEYNGNIYLSTSFATRIMINPTIPEANSLLNWNEGHISDSMNNRILLEDLVSIVEKGVTEVKYVTVKATVAMLHMDRPLSFLSCNMCDKKIDPHVNNGQCNHCTFPTRTNKIRYIATISVMDHTGSATFLLQGNVVKEFLNTSEENFEVNAAKDDWYTHFAPQIHKALWQEYLFHLKIGSNMSKSTLYTGVPIKKIELININREGKFLLSEIEHSLKMKDRINTPSIGTSNAPDQLESEVPNSVASADTSR